MWQIIGSCAALLTMTAFFPQIFKVFHTKSLKDVSLITLLQLSFGVSLWIVYGFYRNDPIIIIANAISLLSLLIMLFLFGLYRRSQE